MAHPLARLLWLRARAGLRRQWRRLRTPRGAAFALLTLGLAGLLLYRAPAATAYGGVAGDTLALYLPYLLLAGCLLTLLTASGPAIRFSAAERHWLLAGPFGHRALLLYKLALYAAGALLSSALVALLVPPRPFSRVALFAATLLAMLLTQLLVAVLGLLWQAGRRRRATRPALWLAAALAGAEVAVTFAGADSVTAVLWRLHDTWSGYLLLAPFRAVTDLLLAGPAPAELLYRGGVAALPVGALLLALLWLGAEAVEQAGSAPPRTRRDSAPASFAAPPYLGGVGPIAWRQLLGAWRNSRKALLALLLLPLLAGPLAVLAGDALATPTKAGLACFFALFVLPRTLLFDFRGDRERIAALQTLPLPAWAVCCGQLATPVLLSSASLLLLLLGAAVCADAAAARLLILAAAFALPLNALLYQIENLFFLVFPGATLPVGRADFDFLGRTLVETAVKLLLLGLAAALAALTAAAALRAGAGYLSAAALAWLVLAAAVAALLPLLALALRRFDPARL